MTKFIATWFYSGLLKPAPGTWGSLAALPFAWVLHGLGSIFLLVGATIVVFFVGWWATQKETLGQESHDPGEIVVDEVVGQWIALWPLSFSMFWLGEYPWVFPWPGILVAFVLFRAFDIFKPGPVGWADKRNDAFDVMFDDVVAGIMAGIVMVLLGILWHLFLI